MRVRDHIALSTAGAALLSPWLGRRVVGPWATSIAIDVDHYLWFCLSRRGWHPLAAVRYFNEPAPVRHSATRLLHEPLTLLAMAALAVRRQWARAALVGMAAHVGLDAYHERRLDKTRRRALDRDGHACESCGAQGSEVGTHVSRQPLLFPSYDLQDHVSLCRECHEAAHARDVRRRPRVSISTGHGGRR